MFLSILFSGVIFFVSTNELQSRLLNFQNNIEETLDPNHSPTKDVIDTASNNLKISDKLILQLIYVNIFILISGGIISYILACKGLAPIKKAHDAQSRYASNVSHELRTPLAVIKTENEVALRDKKVTVKGLKEVLSSNIEEVDKLSKLSKVLLDLSKLDHTKIKNHKININKITSEVINEYKLPKSRILLKPSKQQFVFGNEIAMADLIKELINNSLQYSPKKSKVLVSISQNPEYVKLNVTNTGQGITTDQIPHIFERFYRADSKNKNEEHKGFGLGLSLAMDIAKLHNGDISVRSTPNKTTTFTVALPKNPND